jgi:hypothetical protein
MFLAGMIAAAVSGCPAIPVRTTPNPLLGGPFEERSSSWIAPKPKRLYGVLWTDHSVDGRFAVYARGDDPKTDVGDKVMWLVPRGRTHLSGRRLRIAWWRGGERRLVQYAGRAGEVPRTPRGRKLFRAIYPSGLYAPDEGCWKLRLRTGKIRAAFDVLAQPQPQPPPG